jgi:uncharacterized protein (DUF885 family)/cyclophilin family peptidyl-prolyl cis-trans isomerase
MTKHQVFASSPLKVRAVTDIGDLVLELYGDRAPKSVAAFLGYVDGGRYDGARFARTVHSGNDNGAPPIEVVQAFVDPGSEAPVEIEHESTALTGLTHQEGVVSLARRALGTGTPATFFISLARQPALDFGGARLPDGEGFAAFARVVDGLDLAREIQARPTLEEAPTDYLKGQLIAEPVMIHAMRREPLEPAAQLQALVEDYWAFRTREFPVEATAAGLRTDAHRLEGARLADHARRARVCAAMLARASTIDAAGLLDQDGVSLALVRGQLQGIVQAWELGDHLVPVLFPFGFADLPQHLAQTTALNSLLDLEAFAARLEAIPAYFAENLATLEAGLDGGYRIPRALWPRILGLLDAHLAEGGVAAAIRTRAETPIPGADPKAQAAIGVRIVRAVEEGVLPALRQTRARLAALDGGHLRDSVSICDLPAGRDYYRFKVRQQTSLDLDPDAIHALGLEEIAGLGEELRAVLTRMGEGAEARAVAARLEARIAPDGARLLEQVRATAKRIDALIPRVVGRMPRVTYGVEPLTPEQSRELPPGLAQPSPADRSMPGLFLLTALPERCPLHLVIPLTLHEAWPGHLMQFAIAHELDALPAFRRYGWTDYNGYVEGWALYCERLGHDLGLYDNPEDHFGRLTFDLWRASRLVVDTGLHWKGWSRDQAIAFMVENTFLPPETIASEVDRYIGMPAQALSYKLGERSIRALRVAAEVALGARFSLRDFHDALLALGPVSLDILEDHMRRWIAEQDGKS